MTLLFRDPFFEQHETGHHPERPARLRAVIRQLEERGLLDRCTQGKYVPLEVEAVCQLHDRHMVEKVRLVSEQGGGRLDVDTVISTASFQVGLAAAGACVCAVEQVLTGADPHALCLVRPPGHHATPDRSMGFCLFNNIALAAHHARTRHGLTRILIVDWDVHHGNGTQDIFYTDNEIGFLSIHRYGHGFYPGTGAADQAGARAGFGYTWNVPVAYGTFRQEYLSQFRAALEKAARTMKPELLLISAGFDAHRNDPIGGLGLEVEDFVALTDEVLAVARAYAGGRLVSCLEGGYNLEALAQCVQAHLERLLDDDPSLATS